MLLASVVVIESFAGAAMPYIESYAYTERSATVNASSLNVRSGPGTTYSVVTKLTNGAAVTVIDEKTASDGALWYQIRFNSSNGAALTGYVSRSYLRFPSSYTSDGNFEAHLTAEGFPESYKVRLRELHAQYPSWVFRAQHTNLDWNTAVNEESKIGTSLVHTSSMSSWKSIADGAYDWNTSTWPGFDGSTWVAASTDIVKYYMDPRNFLDETNVFQFLNHTYDSNSQTVEGLQKMVKDTFLAGGAAGSSGSSPTGGDTNTGTGGNSSYGPGVAIGPGETASSDGSSQTPASPAGDGAQSGSTSSGSGSGVIDGSAPTSGGSSNVSLESPHASMTPKYAPVLAEYGPGVALSGPSADTNTNTDVTVTGGTSYVDIIMNAATQSGVNPYVLAAMIIQEQGRNGGQKSISGTEPGYEGYYNFFNVEAYQSGSMSAPIRGLWWASQPGSYGRPWNTPEKAIVGGALFYGNNYVKVGQDTFYLKKFNVQGSNIYKHQYMTNIQAAASEGAVYAKAYSDEMKQTALEFKIPVYTNMPDSPCSQPTTDGSPNNKLLNLNVSGFSMTPTYNKDTLEYNLIVDPSVSSLAVNASAIDSTASVSGSGTVQLQGGANDVRISVTAQNGSVREYIIHVVRQENGPTYTEGIGGSTDNGNNPAGNSPAGIGPGGSGDNGAAGQGGSNSQSGSSGGPGVANPSSDGSSVTPGGSSVTIAPDGSGSLTTQSSGGTTTLAPGMTVQWTENSGKVQMTAAGPAVTDQAGANHAGSQSRGDLNGDGRVTSLDVLKLQRHLLGLETLPADSQAAADMNGDGNITSQDLLLLQKQILGL